MSSPDKKIESIAKRLLAGLYYNPEQIGRVMAEEPVMPTRMTQTLWDVFKEVTEQGEFDTALVETKVEGHPDARSLLRSIKSNQILSAPEAVSFGHKGERLEQWATMIATHNAKQKLTTNLGSIISDIESTDPTELDIEEAQSRIYTATANAVNLASTGHLRHVSDYTEEVYEDIDAWERGETTNYLPSGFYGLDDLITGVPVSELTIFAAPSGAGKTAWLIQLAMQVARRDRGEAVALFSIEMPARELIHRAAATWGQYEQDHPRRTPRAYSGEDAPRYADLHREYVDRFSRLPIYIDESSEPTLSQIKSRVMQIQARHDVALIGVDYDEKVEPDEAPPSEEQRVSKISKGLKVMAKDLTAACVTLSQYNSAPSSQVRPGRNDDLRYSRKKKHEASLILHWYWPHYWIRSGDIDLATDDAPPQYNQQRPERGTLYVGKNRHGAPGSIELDFYANQTRFEDPADPEVGT